MIKQELFRRDSTNLKDKTQVLKKKKCTSIFLAIQVTCARPSLASSVSEGMWTHLPVHAFPCLLCGKYDARTGHVTVMTADIAWLLKEDIPENLFGGSWRKEKDGVVCKGCYTRMKSPTKMRQCYYRRVQWVRGIFSFPPCWKQLVESGFGWTQDVRRERELGGSKGKCPKLSGGSSAVGVEAENSNSSRSWKIYQCYKKHRKGVAGV